MAGRKSIFNPETLKIGGKIRLNSKQREFAYQYAHTFRKKNPDKKFVRFEEDGQVYIKRIS
jgi:hypothetical protein